MIPTVPRLLGFAGLLPALACCTAVLFGGPEWFFTGLALGFGYSALIFSFLGGMWWGLAAARSGEGAGERPGDVPGWIYAAAVLPSLLALALYAPWIFALEWPGPSMLVLGVFIVVSPLVDLRLQKLGMVPGWWLALRWPLTLGLGTATIVMGLAA